MRSDLEASLRGIPSLVSIHVGDLDVADACRRFEAEGYVVSPVLHEFIENFSEVVVSWIGVIGGETSLGTTIEDAQVLQPLPGADLLGHGVAPGLVGVVERLDGERGRER